MVKPQCKSSANKENVATQNGVSKNSLSIKKNDELKVKETLSKLQNILPKCGDEEDQLEIIQQAIYYIQDLRDLLAPV